MRIKSVFCQQTTSSRAGSLGFVFFALLSLGSAPADAQISGRCVMYCSTPLPPPPPIYRRAPSTNDDDPPVDLEAQKRAAALRKAHDLNDSGNKCAKVGNWKCAVSYYEQALKYSPNDKVIQDNLALARFETTNDDHRANIQQIGDLIIEVGHLTLNLDFRSQTWGLVRDKLLKALALLDKVERFEKSTYSPLRAQIDEMTSDRKKQLEFELARTDAVLAYQKNDLESAESITRQALRGASPATNWMTASNLRDLLKEIASSKSNTVGAAGSIQGSVEFAYPDGRHVSASSGAQITMGTKIMTGPKSRIQLLLSDQTVFTLGPDAEISVDEFVYDPKTNKGRLGASVSAGVFRWVTGKIAGEDPASLTVKIANFIVGIRGTDFEVLVRPDKSGYVKTYFGEVSLTSRLTDAVVSVPAGKMILLNADGTFEGPSPLQ